ncbi:glycoside hydrolase family 130 protein [uncultured Desulfobacter sp.]|uniref:glycoside hydrolase family 130 protein n=1 Tax=uncultured Desulfobacter sp. TaxID=240139 RepID=UPI002AAAE3A5|nr:glycoside hydrolase family 130 protein [uncultured Desulfobacter sp.]
MLLKCNRKLRVKRKPNTIVGDASRVITSPHFPGSSRRKNLIVKRICGLSKEESKKLLKRIMKDFSWRHEDLNFIFNRHFNLIEGCISKEIVLSDTQKSLIGAYFTKEYAIESAALFNPSIVPHPIQDHLEKGSLRFVMSLRATGEGHISSIVFRSGVLNRYNTFRFDPVSEFVETPVLKVNPSYKRKIFQHKLKEMNADNDICSYILNELPEVFRKQQLITQMNTLRNHPHFSKSKQDRAFEIIHWLSDSNYEVAFHSDHRISERVIFPVSKNESRGIEDARFVQFFDDNGNSTYYATYTAYNGFAILPQLIETKDFISFKITMLNGKAAQNKGLALFPKKINGQFTMLSRQDGENNHIMFSKHLHFWGTSKVIQTPEYPWEFIQIGNCGSPIETSEGWIVLTHGVGPMRQYCIGAMLLDLENPCKVIARLEQPLLTPTEKEREGYVPNVVYSCGSILHSNELVIPYAMSDINSGIATIKVKTLIQHMRKTIYGNKFRGHKR